MNNSTKALMDLKNILLDTLNVVEVLEPSADDFEEIEDIFLTNSTVFSRKDKMTPCPTDYSSVQSTKEHTDSPVIPEVSRANFNSINLKLLKRKRPRLTKTWEEILEDINKYMSKFDKKDFRINSLTVQEGNIDDCFALRVLHHLQGHLQYFYENKVTPNSIYFMKFYRLLLNKLFQFKDNPQKLFLFHNVLANIQCEKLSIKEYYTLRYLFKKNCPLMSLINISSNARTRITYFLTSPRYIETCKSLLLSYSLELSNEEVIKKLQRLFQDYLNKRIFLAKVHDGSQIMFDGTIVLSTRDVKLPPFSEKIEDEDNVVYLVILARSLGFLLLKECKESHFNDIDFNEERTEYREFKKSLDFSLFGLNMNFFGEEMINYLMKEDNWRKGEEEFKKDLKEFLDLDKSYRTYRRTMMSDEIELEVQELYY